MMQHVIFAGTKIKSDLSRYNWHCGVILLHYNSIGALGQVSIVSHSYQIYFGFPGPDFNFDYGLCDHVIMRFASSYIGEEGWVALSQDNAEVEVGEREREGREMSGIC
jgi:hypothetical protein